MASRVWLLAAFSVVAVRSSHRSCEVCGKFNENAAFANLLPPDDFAPGQANNPDGSIWTSRVHHRWGTHFEVVPLTTDIGGHLPPSFNHNIADMIVKTWKNFKDNVLPKLPARHYLKKTMAQKSAGNINDAFFHWQKNLFETGGDIERSLMPDADQGQIEVGEDMENTTWPELEALPEYQLLRKIVASLSKRYLIRCGLDPKFVKKMRASIFQWAAVHQPGEFHGLHPHTGEFHVAVFYVQAGPRAGKFRMADPRGQHAPFGYEQLHSPRAGDLIIFPSWLAHMATSTAPRSNLQWRYNSSQEEEPYRVVISFNIGPEEGPILPYLWFSDPTSNIGFIRHSPVEPDFEAMGL